MDAKQRERLRKRKLQQDKKAKKSSRHREATKAVARGRTVPYENRRFNRIEMTLEHLYYTNYGWAPRQEHIHNGWLKCRLLHGPNYSHIVPDQIFLDRGGLKWIQPLAFEPVLLVKDGQRISSFLTIHISCGNTVEVRFFNNGIVRTMSDGSQLFRCEIVGPDNLDEYATGDAEWGSDYIPYLRLFHHTTADSSSKIKASGHFQTGSYNIQGANKRLLNVAYAYFTPLDKITTNEDLRRIAMAESGIIELRRDGFTAPDILMPGWEETYKNDILQLNVYRSDPSKRGATIEVWVDSTVLAPQHIYWHDEGAGVYLEFPHSFIHRVGVTPKGTIAFDDQIRVHQQGNLKAFEYVVVGDCTSIAGLIAPYDEEDTAHIMKIERVSDGHTLLDFWFEHRNQDLYTGKKVEVQVFQSDNGGE